MLKLLNVNFRAGAKWYFKLTFSYIFANLTRQISFLQQRLVNLTQNMTHVIQWQKSRRQGELQACGFIDFSFCIFVVIAFLFVFKQLITEVQILYTNIKFPEHNFKHFEQLSEYMLSRRSVLNEVWRLHTQQVLKFMFAVNTLLIVISIQEDCQNTSRL